jgi:hypothetical protein
MNRAFGAALKSSARSEHFWRALKGNYYLLFAASRIGKPPI